MKPARALTVVALVGAAALLVGCASTSGLAPQSSLRSSNDLASTSSLASTDVSPASWPSEQWWTSLGDPQLNALVEEAIAGSPTLRIAAARTQKALAAAGTANAALYPSVNGDLEVTPQHYPEHGLTPPPFAGGHSTFYQLQATLNWEIDFWGKNRSAYESALGQAHAE